jgi:catechol 2,3-dioxygenase-like lactoylglutathione lyase family enzyme
MAPVKLAYVALAVADLAATAGALVKDFGLREAAVPVDGSGRTTPVFSVGTTGLVLFAVDDPFLGGPAQPGLHHIAVAADDLEGAARTLADAGVAAVTRQSVGGLGGRRRLGLSPDATLGIRMYLAEPVALPSPSGGWVDRIDHLGVASEDNGRAIDLFTRTLGWPLESTQTDLETRIALETFTSDKYGAVSHTRPPEIVGGLRVAFVTVGDCELEFLQDFDPGPSGDVRPGRGGTTKQDQSAIARFVASRGAGLHHVALKVKDIDAALAGLGRAGHRLIDTVGRPGSRRARIGFVHPKSLGGVLVHLVEREG